MLLPRKLLLTAGAALLASLPAAVPAQEMPVQAGADIEPDAHGIVESVTGDLDSHMVWIGDRLLRHSILFDGDNGNALAMLDITWSLGGVTPHTARKRGEFYVIEPVYERGQRGPRTDYVTIYDARTLELTGEIMLPTHASEAGHGVALSALLDDERYLVILNMTPADSVTVVDMEERRFVAEIPTAGCSLVYPVGARRFGMLCGNGTALAVELADDGTLARTLRSHPFFDTVADPLSEKGAHDGTRWLFSSFAGYLHEVEFGAEPPALAARWSLLTEEERGDDWRTGGAQHLAYHVASKTLYSLMHQGNPGSHKDAASELWVYNLDARKRSKKIDLPSLMPAFLRPVLDIDSGSFTDSLMYMLLPNLGAHSIVVSQDDEPLLFVRHQEIGAVGVLDAQSGKHLRDIEESGISGGVMSIP